jgi:hypothetical protein
LLHLSEAQRRLLNFDAILEPTVQKAGEGSVHTATSIGRLKARQALLLASGAYSFKLEAKVRRSDSNIAEGAPSHSSSGVRVRSQTVVGTWNASGNVMPESTQAAPHVRDDLAAKPVLRTTLLNSDRSVGVPSQPEGTRPPDSQEFLIPMIDGATEATLAAPPHTPHTGLQPATALPTPSPTPLSVGLPPPPTGLPPPPPPPRRM